MKSLNTLIKLYSKELDDKRRQMVELQNNEEKMQQYSLQMKEDLSKEMEVAAKNPEFSVTIDSYKNVIDQRQDNIKRTLVGIESQKEQLTEEISELFAEVKKMEILVKRKQESRQKELNDKEIKYLDELAAGRFVSDKV